LEGGKFYSGCFLNLPQTEFCEIKKKYDEACKKLEQDINETQTFMTERDQVL
jgi:hypothetical protein